MTVPRTCVFVIKDSLGMGIRHAFVSIHLVNCSYVCNYVHMCTFSPVIYKKNYFPAAIVLAEPERILATNGSSGHTLTCQASSFPTNPYYWVLIGSNGSASTTVATGSVLQLPEVRFEDGGSNYQCIVETQYGNISSDLVEVVGECVCDVSVE